MIIIAVVSAALGFLARWLWEQEDDRRIKAAVIATAVALAILLALLAPITASAAPTDAGCVRITDRAQVVSIDRLFVARRIHVQTVRKGYTGSAMWALWRPRLIILDYVTVSGCLEPGTRRLSGVTITR